MCLASIQPCHVLMNCVLMSADLVCAQHTKLFIALAEPRSALKERPKVRICKKNKSDLPLCLVKECSYEGLCVGIFVYPYLEWFATGFGCCLNMSCGKDAPPMLVGSKVYRIQTCTDFPGKPTIWQMILRAAIGQDIQNAPRAMLFGITVM